MNNIFLQLAGFSGMGIAILHGFIGATKVVQPVQGISLPAKRVLHAIMFLSAVYWFAAGAVLAAAPAYLDTNGQRVVALIAAAIFASGSLGNVWATRGRHPGGWLLALAAGLALAGALMDGGLTARLPAV